MHRLHLNFEEFYSQPIETVWRALTDPQALCEWFMPCDFQPIIGHRFTIRGTATDKWRGFTHCQVVRLEAPTVMEWSWESADIEVPTRVLFELRSVQSGTMLILRHTGLTTSDDQQSLSTGWPQKLRQLDAYFNSLITSNKGLEP